VLSFLGISRSSSPERPTLIVHQLCPPHLRQLVEDTVQSFDDAWLLPLEEGEVFESGKACLAPLQGFALSRGFAVVTNSSTATRYRFGCIHRGEDTKDWRKLEKHVAGESRVHHYYLSYKDARTSAAASRAHSCPRSISGSTPGTYRAPRVYGPCKDGTRALEEALRGQQTVCKQPI
jgi:hypothetical protein